MIDSSNNRTVDHDKHELRGIRKDGTEFHMDMTMAFMTEGEKCEEFCTYIRDITEQKLAAIQLLEMATHDPLTGLPNRRLLIDRLGQVIENSKRAEDLFAVLFIDLDRFKPVNDTYGHEVGDILLQTVAERLGAIIRTQDTAARIGGDEFIIVLPGLKPEVDINQIVEKIITTLSLPFHIKKNEITIGASIGIGLYPRDGNTAEELLQFSDQAMYKAKTKKKTKNPGDNDR